MTTRCKITVLKCNYDEQLAPDWVTRPCQAMHVGDVYKTTGAHNDKMPEGFCYLAWESLRTFAVTIASGGKVFGEYPTYTGCCPNGARPVVFLLEPEKVACESETVCKSEVVAPQPEDL